MKIVQINSMLSKVPIKYVQDKLTELGPTYMFAVPHTCMCAYPAAPHRMAHVTAHSQIDEAVTKENIIPHRIRVHLDNISTEPLTHVFAMHQPTPNACQCMSLFPTHDIVWAANSTTLPELGHPRQVLPPTLMPGSEITLPIVPVRIADVPTFPAFMDFIYDKHVDLLLARLLPNATPDAMAQTVPRAIVAYAEQLAMMCSVVALLDQVRFICGIWENATAFGVYDAGLWAALDLAWEIILHTLAFATGTSLDEMDSVHPVEEDNMMSTPPPPRRHRRQNEPAGAPALGQ
ncbi:hypothetical protein WOLCODRAFT_19664 [Wolfiporia cocos MD-104 SS10]|uniref:Uncharacterized protein n=1 Tax=Wolfiporia cocos (strain MD-104) TaxID=742152 RepID=A0A2H3IY64_WOLCO|nr:hypothetical protein WOLCODRAFT_19664 [Wolfiporia cocos MD-104 SS10]